MVLNYIWIAFFIIAFVIALVKLIFLGDVEVFPAMMNSTFDTSKTAFEISLGLTGVLSLWLGIMKIGEKGGVINLFARVLSPVFTKLFPDIPKGHPATGSIFMNIAANMLGLDNAATPLGLKAMEQLQEINPKKDTASNPMIMFLVLNTSGLTIIPVGVMTSCTAGSCPANRHLHPHSAGYILFDPGWYHSDLALSENQPPQQDFAAHAGRHVRLGGRHHLGILTTSGSKDRPGINECCQHYPFRGDNRVHHIWH